MKFIAVATSVLFASVASAISIGAVPECATTSGLCVSGDLVLGDTTILYAEMPSFLKCCGGYTCKLGNDDTFLGICAKD